jgi:hypothetical protein
MQAKHIKCSKPFHISTLDMNNLVLYYHALVNVESLKYSQVGRTKASLKLEKFCIRFTNYLNFYFFRQYYGLKVIGDII